MPAGSARARSVVAALAVMMACAVGAPASASAYGFIQEWGSAGTADAKFTALRDVTTDTHGNVFTLEADRIQKFGPDRAFLRSRKADAGQSFRSATVFGAGSSGVLYVIDRDHGVLRYRTSDLAPLGALPLTAVPATANFAKPRAITTDYLGNLIIAFPNDEGAAPPTISGVAMYQPGGTFIRVLGEYGTTDPAPGRLAYDTPVDIDDDGEVAGRAWVTDSVRKRIISLDRSGDPNASQYSNAAGTWTPGALAIMPLDPTFDNGTNPQNLVTTIYTYDAVPGSAMWVWRGAPNNGFRGRFGDHGTGSGKFDQVVGIDIDALQRMFVADAGQSKILEYGNGGSPGPGDTEETPPSTATPPAPQPDQNSGSGVPPPPTNTGLPSKSAVDQALENLQPVICIPFYAAQYCGTLPQPDRLEVCVSLWQDCNGFQGMKAAKNGTIDMSGLPSSLLIDAGCGGTAKKAQQAARRLRAPGGDPTECILNGYFEAPAGSELLRDKQLEAMYYIDARTLKGEVGQAYSIVEQGLRVATEKMGETEPGLRVQQAVRLEIGKVLDQYFDRAAAPGVPFNPPTAPILDAGNICAGISPDTAAAECRQVVTALNQTLIGTLGILAQRKKNLFLDLTVKEYLALMAKQRKEKEAKAQSKERAARRASNARKRGELLIDIAENERARDTATYDGLRKLAESQIAFDRRFIARLDANDAAGNPPLDLSGLTAPATGQSLRAAPLRLAPTKTSPTPARQVSQQTLTLGYGQVTLKPGQRGKLKIDIPKATRAYLRALRAKGLKSITAYFVLEGGPSPSQSTRQFRKMTILLAKKTRKR